MSNGSSTVPPLETWPPPRANAVDPYGLQSSSTASTAAGLLLTATGGSASAASALGLGTSVKMAAAGFSLATFGQGSLCAGLVLIGLGIALNIASLAVRWQLARQDEIAYARAVAEARRKEEADKTKPEPPSPRGD